MQTTPEQPDSSTGADEWARIYESKLATYEEFTSKLQDLIAELVRKQDIELAQIEGRTKSVDSFLRKITREYKEYHNPLAKIADFVGIRVVAYYREDVARIGEIIEEEFAVDWENSRDVAQILDPDTLGYLSVHYVVALSSARERLPEWEAFQGTKAEIQLRTVLQHAWAEIEHTLLYKAPRDLSDDLKRRLFRLSALPELADEQFSAIKRST